MAASADGNFILLNPFDNEFLKLRNAQLELEQTSARLVQRLLPRDAVALVLGGERAINEAERRDPTALQVYLRHEPPRFVGLPALLVAGCYLQVAGCCFLPSFWLLVPAFWLLAATFWLFGYSSPVAGRWLLIACCWLLGFCRW